MMRRTMEVLAGDEQVQCHELDQKRPVRQRGKEDPQTVQALAGRAVLVSGAQSTDTNAGKCLHDHDGALETTTNRRPLFNIHSKKDIFMVAGVNTDLR